MRNMSSKSHGRSACQNNDPWFEESHRQGWSTKSDEYPNDCGEPPPEIHVAHIATRSASNVVSGGSMNNRPDFPSNVGSPDPERTPQIGSLSLGNHRQDSRVFLNGSKTPTANQQSTSKRTASSKLPKSNGNEHPPGQPSRNGRGSAVHVQQNEPSQHGLANQLNRDPHVTAKARAMEQKANRTRKKAKEPRHKFQSSMPKVAVPCNRGGKTGALDTVKFRPPPACAPAIEWQTRKIKDNSSSDMMDLTLQPESSVISPEQLAAEVKGIYSGLVMVEAKCINIDAAQSAESDSRLGQDQWQALIALHRTLLYEHHDFLMATQHPSASAALKGLASKYTMPARMWKHGIHAFLEVLRHRRPHSQEYMLAFIYLAYQMMALLYETVPSFVDTWIECLGDLARYRMAIEDDREIHAIWGGAAGDWYNMGSDRHPGTGRLYHHLGILERISLKKNFFYAKALTTVNPFPSARDSLATLCGPIVQDEQKFRTGYKTAEGRIMLFHAMLFMSVDDDKADAVGNEALMQMREVSAAKVREWGVSLVVVNIAALLELGSITNALWRWFGKAIYDEANSSSRPSSIAPHAFNIDHDNDHDLLCETTSSLQYVNRFTYMSFSTIIRLGTDHQSVRETLPSVHAMLVWVHALYNLQSRMSDETTLNTVRLLIDPQHFDWVALSHYLNTLGQHEPISARTIKWAEHGKFWMPERLTDHKHLPEDFAIRGLVWTELYFPSDWFKDCQSDVESRSIEIPENHELRAKRVQWLGVFLAHRTGHLKFDNITKSFHASVEGPVAFELAVAASARSDTTASVASSIAQDEEIDMEHAHRTTPLTSNARSTSAFSTHSDSDGYVKVSPTKPGLDAENTRTTSSGQTSSEAAHPKLRQSKTSNSYVHVISDDPMEEQANHNIIHFANDDDPMQLGEC